MANPNQPWGPSDPAQGGGYPPQGGGYPPQQQAPGYPPQQQAPGYPPQQQAPGYPPQQQAPGYPQRALMGGGYEFDENANSIIGSAGTWTNVLGVVCILQAANSAAGSQHSYLGAAVNVAVGVLLVLAGVAFRNVVTTQGNDIAHLMTALSKLGTVLLIRIICLCLAAVFIVIAVLGVMAVGAAVSR